MDINQDKRIRILASETPVKAVWKMGAPVTMGMLFMVAYNLTDTYFIGLLHDDYQLAASNLAYPVMMILIAISGIVGNGGASYIARCMGAGKIREARHTLTIGFEMILISGLVLGAAGLIFLHPIVRILGAREDTFSYTAQYTAVMFAGALFSMANYALGQLMRSEGSTFYSMVGMIAGTVANIILDPIFIFALDLQIMGAAIATVLGNVLSTFIFLWYYYKKKTLLQPSIRMLKMEPRIIQEIMVVGIPHTLEQFLSTASILVLNNLAAAYGGLTVAAMGISSKIMSFGNYIYQGMAAGCQPLMGYNYGAKNYGRMRQLVISGIFVIDMIEIGIMILFGIFAPWLVGLFTRSPEVLAIGTKTLRAAMLILPFVGITAIVRNTYNAIGKPMQAFLITVVRQLLLYIPFLILFDQKWGYDGLIHAQPCEEFLCMIFSLFLLFGMLGKLDKESNKIA